ncbi:hypothetical protein AB833_17185 [Chromatiales bacterium (ex Bugula neritina AB1)]|nr:hypothetical protein AB833_17185 [Chromatiales bacterium (ex Bugula neritina AB1)]
MKLLKRLLLGLIAVVALVVIAGAVLINTIDLNRHKDRIQQVVLDKTGRELQINGEISASFFPWIGLSLNDVSFANALNFAGADFAKVSSSDLRVQVLPLLTGTINVNLVELHGLELTLQKDSDGKTNWDDLMSTTAVVETNNGTDDVVQEVEAGAPVIAALSVGGLVVSDARVLWSDQQAGNEVVLESFNLQTGAIRLAEPFEFETDFTFSSDSAGVAADVTVSGSITANPADNVYQLSGLQLKTNASGSGLPLERLEASVSGELIADLDAQTFDVTGLQIEAVDIPIRAEIHGTGLLGEPNIFGNIKSDPFDVAKLLSELKIELPPSFDQSLLTDAIIGAEFQQSGEQLLVKEFVAGTSGIRLNGDMQLTNLSRSPVLSGTISSDNFNPGPWAASFGVEPADKQVLQQAKISAAVRQSGQLLSLNNIDIDLDDFKLQGNIEVTDINAAVPALKFALAGSEIDLDQYLPAATEEVPAAEESAPADTGATAAPLFPVDLLRELNIDGEVTLARLKAAGITVTDIALPIVAEQGRLELTEARAALYSGTVFSSLALDVAADEPRLTLSTNLNGVQAEPLLVDVLQDKAPLSGAAILSIDLLSRGNTIDDLLGRSSGAINTRFTDGALNGINIAHEIRKARAFIGGQQLSAVESELKTDFTELSISAEIENGVLHSDDLAFKSPLLRLSGEGAVSLVEQSVDYLLQVLVSATSEGQGGKELTELNGLKLPVPIRGKFNDLSTDFTGVLIAGLKSDFANQLRSRKDALIEKQKAIAAERLKQKEDELKARLQAEREAAEAKAQERRKILAEKARAKQIELEEQIEAEKSALKDKLENKLKKGLSDLLGN